MPPGGESESAEGQRRAPRIAAEVAGACAILLGVLAILDVFAIHDASLLLSFAPFVLLVIAAVARLTFERVAAWAGVFGVLAVLTGDLRHAGLAYPALVLALMLLIQRSLERRT